MSPNEHAVPRIAGRRGAERRRFATAARAAEDRGLRRLAIALSDPDPAARVQALGVVGELSEDVATSLLAGALVDTNASVRCAAAAAAAQAKAHGVVFSLIIALEDPDLKVRKAAAAALATITGKDTDFGDDEDQRSAKIEELKRWWKQLRFEQLAGKLDSEVAK
ncbi:MAG: HEAT repeat domain-containing protein [Myxococcota bacterium]